MSHSTPEQPLVVFFDGTCLLCDRAVDFLIHQASPESIQLASLQSAYAQAVLGHLDLPDSVVCIDLAQPGEVFTKSAAVSRILRQLGGVWAPGSWGLRLLPQILADAGYDLVSRNRTRWFPQRQHCRVPTDEDRSFFRLELEHQHSPS